jgi:hypothetical protein
MQFRDVGVRPDRPSKVKSSFCIKRITEFRTVTIISVVEQCQEGGQEYCKRDPAKKKHISIDINWIGKKMKLHKRTACLL